MKATMIILWFKFQDNDMSLLTIQKNSLKIYIPNTIMINY